MCNWKWAYSFLLNLLLVKFSGSWGNCSIVNSIVLSSSLLAWRVRCHSWMLLATLSFSTVIPSASNSSQVFISSFFLGLISLALSGIPTPRSSNKWWFWTSDDLHGRVLASSLTNVLLCMIQQLGFSVVLRILRRSRLRLHDLFLVQPLKQLVGYSFVFSWGKLIQDIAISLDKLLLIIFVINGWDRGNLRRFSNQRVT